ncbi:hypothetical protein GGQ64_005238 [Rhizobium azooxidifex]|uniref:Uncharacterized protein n=1 Tax=Mycoplana azooxidifex TaxID=1636188 RepID=A0A7W6DEW2_9HYPH|nr:hypothetical protein [Mycoplana azooxidifex]
MKASNFWDAQKAFLHEHFRAVTAMTPLQCQKQLRLHEARSLMLKVRRSSTANTAATLENRPRGTSPACVLRRVWRWSLALDFLASSHQCVAQGVRGTPVFKCLLFNRTDDQRGRI